jgi:hypothetical protein
MRKRLPGTVGSVEHVGTVLGLPNGHHAAASTRTAPEKPSKKKPVKLSQPQPDDAMQAGTTP